MDLVFKGAGRVLDQGHSQGNGKGQDHGHDIEAHLPLDGMNVLKVDAVAQVEQQKDDDGQKGSAVWFFGIHEQPPFIFQQRPV